MKVCVMLRVYVEPLDWDNARDESEVRTRVVGFGRDMMEGQPLWVNGGRHTITNVALCDPPRVEESPA